jgi:hypothetical protein
VEIFDEERLAAAVPARGHHDGQQPGWALHRPVQALVDHAHHAIAPAQ